MACQRTHTHTVTGELIIGKEATCNEDGWGYTFCSQCGEMQDVIDIPSTNDHDIVTIPAIEATCSQSGATEGEKCCKCGEVMVEPQRIPPKAHTQTILPAVEATCTETGLSEGRQCTVCGEIVVAQQEIPKAAHREVYLMGTEATCSKPGLTEGKKCSACGEILVAQQEIPMIAHTYTDKYDEICNKCGYVRSDAECAHNETDIIKGYDATCTSSGLTDGEKCKKCGEILVSQTVISAKGHNEVTDEAVEATCTSTGLTEGKHCGVCNMVLTAQEVVSLKPHTEVVDEAVEPTCTTIGLTEGKHCGVCGTVLVAQKAISAKGHSFGEKTTLKEPTCTEEGEARRDCLVCDYSEISVLKPSGHKYQYTYIRPTCTEKGYLIYTCINCNHSYEENYKDELGHNYVSVTVEPTKDNQGYTTHTCSRCESSYVDDFVPATGYTVGLRYQLNEDGESYTCEGFKLPFVDNEEEIVIPSTYNGLPVTKIGAQAFSELYNIEYQKVILPNTITAIEEEAFAGGIIEEITLPNSVEWIGVNAFSGCSKLNIVNYNGNLSEWCNIEFQNAYSNPLYSYVPYDSRTKETNLYINGELLTEVIVSNEYMSNVNNYAFYGCSSIKAVTLLDSTIEIGWLAFAYCYSLTDVTIGDTFSGSLGQGEWFYGCSQLTNFSVSSHVLDFGNVFSYTGFDEKEFLSYESNPNYWLIQKTQNVFFLLGATSYDIPEGTVIICKKAFYTPNMSFQALKTITMPDSVKYIGDYAFAAIDTLTDINISNGVEYIGNYAFAETSITEINIPDGVEYIGDYAFYNCDQLTTVFIPQSVEYIGSGAFVGCDSLVEIVVDEDNPNYTSIDGALYNKDKSIILSAPAGKQDTHFVVDENVKIIDDFAFSDYSALISITLPNSMTSIGNNAFSGCVSLTNVTIPNSISEIGKRAFSDCTSLIHINIPDSITSISEYMFSGCSSLSNVSISNSIINIGDGAFWNCTSLTSIEVDENNAYYKSIDGNLYTKDGKTLIQYAVGKTDISFTIPNSVTNIDDGAFKDCTSLASVVIPNSVTSIGKRAFYHCTSLTSIEISDSVTSIGDYAFYNCITLVSIEIPNSVTSVGSGVFYGCTALTSAKIGDSVNSVGQDAFKDCTSLASVVIPDSVTSIGSGAFYRCKSLASVVIPNSVKWIDQNAFYGCTSLTSIIIPDSVTSIYSWAFRGCDKLTIYCEASSKPSGWQSDWNYSNCPVVWGYTGE